MLKRIVTLCLSAMGSIVCLFGQEDSGLKISGSVDTYYKYDFADTPNIGTSFADEHNSISIGMIDILLEKTVGKASFVGEVAFGPRNAGSAGPATGDFQPRIQNLFVSYALTDELSITGGYMGTFVGYEIISPTGNFNYSTSYLFTNGPFQNAGVKLEYAFSEKFALMAGVFNPWNVYTAPEGVGPSSFGAQLYVSPVDGWDAYVNFVTGGESGTEIDLTTTFQISDAFMLGLNAASYTNTVEEGNQEIESTFAGAAVYAQLAASDNVAFGVRYEYFDANAEIGILSSDVDANVSALTISANIKGGPLTFIPEIRFDTASEDIFADSDGNATNSAAQIVLAAVYGF